MGKYLLPDGETLVTELKCAVVSYPDDPRYRRALWGAISQLTKYWMWEPDGDGGEYDAADSWDEAYNQTLENFDMLDQILDAAERIDANTDELEGLIRGLEFVANCCGEPDPTNGDFYTDDVEDGTGDVPQNIIDAGFASGATDWESFEDYKCMIAHVVLDDMIGKLTVADGVVDAAGDVIGGIAAITAIVTAIFTGGLSAMAIGILASLGAAAGLYKAIAEGVNLSSLASALESNRQDLVCEFMKGDGPQASYDSMIAEADTLFTDLQMLAIRNLNSGPVSKALYGARYDQQDMAQRLLDAGYTNPAGFNCECAWDFDYTYTFDTGGEEWSRYSNQRLEFNAGTSEEHTEIDERGLVVSIGLTEGADYKVELIEGDLDSDGLGSLTNYVEVQYRKDDGTWGVLGTVERSAMPASFSFDIPDGDTFTFTSGGSAGDDMLRLWANYTGGSPGTLFYADNIRVAGSVVP